MTKKGLFLVEGRPPMCIKLRLHDLDLDPMNLIPDRDLRRIKIYSVTNK